MIKLLNYIIISIMSRKSVKNSKIHKLLGGCGGT